MAAVAQRLETWRRFLRAHAAVTRQLDADLVAGHGLTLNDYEVLLYLGHEADGRLRPSQLTDRVLLTRSGITRLLAGLEQAGYVSREHCPADRRVWYAVLTEAGWAKLREAGETHLGGVGALFVDRFDEAELDRLGELLARLPGAAELDGTSCSIEAE